MKNKEIRKRFFDYLKPHKLKVVLGFLFSLISSISILFVPILIGKAIDKMIAPNFVDFNSIYEHIAIMAILTALSILSNYAMNLTANKIAFKVVETLRDQTYKKINALPLQTIDNIASGSIINMMINDAEMISNGLIQSMIQLFSGIVTILVTIGLMFALNPILATLIILLTPLSIIVANFISKKSWLVFKTQSEDRAKLASNVNEYVKNIKTTKYYGDISSFQNSFNNINNQMEKSGLKSEIYASFVNPCTRFVNNIIYATTILVASLLSLKGTGTIAISVGTVISFLAYTQQYSKPFNEISVVIAQLQSMKASYKRIDDFHMLKNSPSEKEKPDLYDKINCLEVNNLSFSYDNGTKNVLNNISFTIKNNEHIAIVGPTGCGKTTLINLIMRFYDPTDGDIKINNHSLLTHTKESVRKNFGMVLQDTNMFSDTIKNNIKIAKLDASDEEIMEACKKAHAHEFIMTLERGYNTLVSNNDNVLSSGQKQLIAISRIFLLDPPIILLDEATSDIDTRTELLIQKTLDEFSKNKMSITIAHRLSTVMNSDNIIVMKDGYIEEQGKHEDLLKNNGLYSQLYNSLSD